MDNIALNMDDLLLNIFHISTWKHIVWLPKRSASNEYSHNKFWWRNLKKKNKQKKQKKKTKNIYIDTPRS